MPSRFTPLVTEQYYHIFNRGSNKQPIFLGVKDYSRALEILRYYSYNTPPVRYSKFLLLSNEDKDQIWRDLLRKNDPLVKIVCYCLMPNHFHLLLKQDRDNGISTFLRLVQNSYTRYFNTKHERIGSLLQGQFKAVRIEDDEQLLHLNRYIHLNPYTSYVVKNLKDLNAYLWSSLPEYLGRIENGMCDKEIILSNFKFREGYMTFIFDQAEYQRELDQIKHLILEK